MWTVNLRTQDKHEDLLIRLTAIITSVTVKLIPVFTQTHISFALPRYN